MGVISKTFAHRANHRLPSFVTLKVRLYWCGEDPQAARRAAKLLNGPGTNPLMVADLRTGEFRLKSGINVAPTDYPDLFRSELASAPGRKGNCILLLIVCSLVPRPQKQNGLETCRNV